MKRIFSWGLLFVFLLLVVGCGAKDDVEDSIISDAIKFKEEYESLNTQVSGSGKEYRTVNIKEDNPMVYKEASDIISAINNKESFIVYFGFPTCPWCRSMIENLIKAAQDENIDAIYYVDVYDIRDVKSLDENGKVVTVDEGSEDYLELLDLLKDVLSDYTLVNDAGKTIKVGEKRIYAPNIVYVKDGVALGMTSGNSDLQTDPYMELTDEILKDSYNKIVDLFQK